MLKLWIVGSESQVGKAILSVLDPMELEVLCTDKEELDITNTEDVLSYGEINRPDVIINCAAVTDTKLCEAEPELAYRVNALGARNLSLVARKHNAKIVQISTDDVFDGKKETPYTEFDDTHPLTVYGRSKRAGENYVKEFTHKHFIIRSTWVYGEGKNFVNALLQSAETETEAEATGALAVLGFFSNALQIALIIRQSKTIHKRPKKTVPTPIPTMNKFDTKIHLL